MAFADRQALRNFPPAAAFLVPGVLALAVGFLLPRVRFAKAVRELGRGLESPAERLLASTPRKT